MDPRDSSNNPPPTEERSPALSRRQLIHATGLAGAAAVIISRSGPATSAAPARPVSGARHGSAALTQEDQPIPGGTLNAAMQVDVLSLDPHFVSSYSSTLVIEQVYNGLIQLDENANVLPDLAESWTVSPDGLVYDFKLRRG